MTRYVWKAFLLIFVAGYFFGCGSSEKTISNLIDRPLAIDGDASEWTNDLKTIPGDNIAFGFKNDDKNLYLCMVTSDRGKIIKMMTSGLTIWVDNGVAEEKIGINYPGKVKPEDFMKENNLRRPEDGDARREAGNRMNDVIAKKKDIAILNNDKIAMQMLSIENNNDLHVKMDFDKAGKLVYEMQVPLSGKNGLIEAGGSGTARKLKLSFETGEQDKKEMAPAPGGGMPGEEGGMPSEGSGRGGNRGGMRGGGNGGPRGGGPEGGANRMENARIKYSFDLLLDGKSK